MVYDSADLCEIVYMARDVKMRIVIWVSDDESIILDWPIVPVPGDRLILYSGDFMVIRREIAQFEGEFLIHIFTLKLA